LEYKDPEHIKKIIDAIRNEQKLKKGLLKARIVKLWKELWGEHINSYTQSVYFENGKLTVYLTSSTLREEINRNKIKIIKKMNEELGKDIIKSLILK